jgi:hypothetical protein
MLKSKKLPAATGTLPVTVQLPPEVATHANTVFTMLPTAPFRSVTVTVFDCREKTVSEVAVQAAGTQVCTASPSLALAFGFVTE